MKINRTIKTSFLLLIIVTLTGISTIQASSCEIIPSKTQGFYEGSIELTLTTTTGCTLFYTLDASSPKVEGIEYSGERLELLPNTTVANISYYDQVSHEGSPWREPLEDISVATILRVVAKDKDGKMVTEKSFTYFMGDEFAFLSGIPVVSLTFDEELFFDHETGIYVTGKRYEEWREQYPDTIPDGGTPANYIQRGDEWEKPTHLEYFDEEGNIAVEQSIGIRIHGGWSRMYPQKSLRIYARNNYGKSTISYPFFKDSDKVEFKRLILRNSGQDWDRTKLKDIYLTSLVRHFKAETQAYQPVIVFLNGEYWGLYNLRERIDQHYLELKYGIDRDGIDMIDAFGIADEGNTTRYNAMYQFFLDNHFESDELYAEALTKIDLDTFIEHYVSQIFVGNSDWPEVNQDIWSKQTNGYESNAPYGHDGKFYWTVADQDFGFLANQYDVNSLVYATQEGGHRFGERSNLIFLRLLENDTFKNEFIVRFLNHLLTTYDTARMVQKLNELRVIIAPHIDKQYKRWVSFDVDNDRIRTVTDWQNFIHEMEQFALRRNDSMKAHLVAFFNLSNEEFSLILASEDFSTGSIQLNGKNIDIDNPLLPTIMGSYSAKYLKNLTYTVKAVPKDGYEFDRWEGSLVNASNQFDPELSFTGDEDVQLLATFKEQTVEENPFPIDLTPHVLGDGDYLFESWSAENPEYTYPPSMYFTQSMMNDPGLNDPVDELYGIPNHEYAASDSSSIGFPYNTKSRTRIEGLGEDGIAFINTGRGRDVGAAVLVLDATGQTDIQVYWEASTLDPNFRTYHIRMQVRTSQDSEWVDLLDENGEPIEYRRSEEVGHSQVFGPITLPDSLNNSSMLQLRWKYYYTGVRLPGDGGNRDKLRLDNIKVTTLKETSIDQTEVHPTTFTLHQNYPNPFNPTTQIRFALPETQRVTVRVYDVSGRMVSELVNNQPYLAGNHQITFDGSLLSTGVYIYRLTTDSGFTMSRKLVLIK